MSAKPKVVDLIESISSDVKTIVRGEIELAKAELVPQVKSFGLGAGLFGAAGYFALVGASLLFTAFSLGTAWLFVANGGWEILPALFIGFLIWAMVFFLCAGALALIGKKKVAQLQGPKKAIAMGEETLTAVGSSLRAGQAAATAGRNKTSADVIEIGAES